MKRIFAAVMALALMVPFAIAESIDVENMSYDELYSIREQIVVEQHKRPEWQEIIVPVGKWTVGVDISVGYWHIEAVGDRKTMMTYWWGPLECKTYSLVGKGEGPQTIRGDAVDIDLQAGDAIEVWPYGSDESVTFVMSPYLGRYDSFSPSADIVGTDYDLSGFSFVGLRNLMSQVNRLMWESGEWSKVVLLQGWYAAGEDIAIGDYRLTCLDGKDVMLWPQDADIKKDYRVVPEDGETFASITLNEVDELYCGGATMLERK